RAGFAGVVYSNVAGLDVFGANSVATYNVNSTSVDTLLSSMGQNTFNVGTGDLDKLKGPVTVDHVGSGTVVLDDHLSTSQSDYLIASDSVRRSGFDVLSYSSNVQSLKVKGANVGDSFTVVSTSAPTTIQGGTGNDFFFIGHKDLNA